MILTARTYLDVYHALLVIDSDGGDPTQRTPNQCLLNQAFAHHGLAEREAACELGAIESWEIDDSPSNIFRPGSTAEIRLKTRNASPQALSDLAGTLAIDDLPGTQVGWGENTRIGRVVINFDLQHSFWGHLRASLKAPDGNPVGVYERLQDGKGGVLHYSADITQHFKNNKIAGDWQFTMLDYGGPEDGSLDSLTLTLTPTQYSCR